MPRGVRREDLNVAAGEVKEKMRQRFGRDEDRLLMMQVKMDAPYKARHGAIGETWDGVAERLNQHPGFRMRPIKGTTAKARFDMLMYRHRQWMENASAEDAEEMNNPYRKIMSDLVKEVDIRPKTNTTTKFGEEEEGQQKEESSMDSRASTRLGKRRTSTSSDNFETEPPTRREIFVLPRAIGTEQMHIQPGDSFPAADANIQELEPNDEPRPLSPPLPQSPVVGDLTTMQQAMAELLRMQHTFATRPNEVGMMGFEKMNEARLREEEERTKQRSLELEIEMQRTKRRQLELEFEREERRKDREEQAKLIARLVGRLEPTND